MKSTLKSSPYFFPDSQKTVDKETKASPAEQQSPYLKAVLSEKRIAGSGRVFSIGGSSMDAALRYIVNTGKLPVPAKVITPVSW